MKLILCPKCSDVRALRLKMTFCDCRKSYGSYVNEIDAVVGGIAIPIGFSNPELIKALRHVPHEPFCKEDQFLAWVIAVPCDTVKRIK